MGDVQIPKKHKALVYDKPGSISTKIEELDVPEPGPGEVLINLYVPPHYNSHPWTTLQLLELKADECLGLTLVSATPIWASCSMPGRSCLSRHKPAK